jgi:GH15 family glucan-1,4-alpha-glucosidase
VRRRLAWFVAALSCVAVSVALISANATASPDLAPSLLTGSGWRATQDVPGLVLRGPSADAVWLAQGSVPGKGTRWQEMVRTALLDLHQLAEPNGAVAAGAASRWNYAWPRDTAFAAVALARTGHHREALQSLAFLERVQLADGGFEARYRLSGNGPPDDRARQSDGAGWALWAAWEVSRASSEQDQVSPSTALRPLLDQATAFALAATRDGRQLPPPSPDYWEVGVSRTSLGTVAPLLAGLGASQQLYAALGEPVLARRSASAASRLRVLLTERFAGEYQRFGAGSLRSLRVGGGGLDAAVTFLMPPFAQNPAPQVVDAWTLYQSAALRTAGGLAPGSQWKQDGISWTPETALVAYTAAVSGRPGVAARWMDWLSAQRTPWGSLPEKVLASGAPAGPAPLAWTAALVVLTAAELESPGRS